MKKSKIPSRNIIILSTFAAVFTLFTIPAIGFDRMEDEVLTATEVVAKVATEPAPETEATVDSVTEPAPETGAPGDAALTAGASVSVTAEQASGTANAAEAVPAVEAEAPEAVPAVEAEAPGAVPTAEAEAPGAVPAAEAEAPGAVPAVEAEASGAVPTAETGAPGAAEPAAEAAPTPDEAASASEAVAPAPGTTEPASAAESAEVAPGTTEPAPVAESAEAAPGTTAPAPDVVPAPEADMAAYSVAEYETPHRMYTTATVNVRTGAGMDYDKVGKLGWGSETTVVGETSNGWFEVAFDGGKAFILGDYMTPEVPGTPYVFVGDSRTVQLQMAIGSTDKAYIAQVGEGYNYFKNTALPAITDYAGSGTNMIINFGVNDLANASKYITLVNNNIDAWTEAGINVYYAAVTPVGNCSSVTNTQIENFNKKLQSELDPRVKWIDGYTYLTQTGFSTPDGLHYNKDTYKSLYSYYMSVLTQA